MLTLSLPRPRDGPGKVTGTELPLKESGNLLKVLSLSSSGWVPLANQAQMCPPPQAPPPASCSLGSHRAVLGWARTSDSSPSPEWGPGPRFLTFKCWGGLDCCPPTHSPQGPPLSQEPTHQGTFRNSGEAAGEALGEVRQQGADQPPRTTNQALPGPAQARPLTPIRAFPRSSVHFPLWLPQNQQGPALSGAGPWALATLWVHI